MGQQWLAGDALSLCGLQIAVRMPLVLQVWLLSLSGVLMETASC